MRSGNLLAPPAVLLAVLCAACSGTEKCRVGSDCPSGVCLSSGECGERNYPDAAEEVLFPDAGAQPDAALAPQADAGGAGCQPNGDGVITRDELPVVLGARATFRVAHDVAVDTAGALQPDGTLLWDLTGPYDGEAEVQFSPQAVSGQWFADDFSNAEFSLRLSGQDDTLGVLQRSANALLLAGMASPESSTTATNVAYLGADFSGAAAPITSLVYPLEVGASWSSAGIIEGDYGGDHYHCDSLGTVGSCEPWPNCCVKHVYTSTVDKAGKVVTPLGTFEAVRVKSVLEYYVYLYGAWGDGYVSGQPFKTIRTYLFVSECFSTVAAIVSQEDEEAEEFTTAAEVRRLSP